MFGIDSATTYHNGRIKRSLAMYQRKISMVYWIANGMNRKMDYRKAQLIASRLTYQELERLVKLSQNRRSDAIGIGTKPSELKGTGLEYLVVNGEVIAKLYDGNLVQDARTCNNEKTVLAA